MPFHPVAVSSTELFIRLPGSPKICIAKSSCGPGGGFGDSGANFADFGISHASSGIDQLRTPNPPSLQASKPPIGLGGMREA